MDRQANKIQPYQPQQTLFAFLMQGLSLKLSQASQLQQHKSQLGKIQVPATALQLPNLKYDGNEVYGKCGEELKFGLD